MAAPWGFLDILSEEAQAREEITQSVKEVLCKHNYLPVETSLLEDKATLEAAGRVQDTPFKLFDDDGSLLVVRPDNTLSIVRMVTSRMSRHALPLRLRYVAPVVREEKRGAGRSRQFTQLGYELIDTNDTSAQSDVEIVSLVQEVCQKLKISNWRVVCSSVRPFKELLALCNDKKLTKDVLKLVHANNFVDLDERVDKSSLSPELKFAIKELPRICGDVSVLDYIDTMLFAAGITRSATEELRTLVAGLTSSCNVLFDFSLTNSFDYYTGLVFKAYAANLSDPIGSGGRYDSVFDDVFEEHARVSAAGFAFSLERLEAACSSFSNTADTLEQGGDVSRSSFSGKAAYSSKKPLRIAVPKGSLKKDTIRVLSEAGIDCTALDDPGRHLVVRGADTCLGKDNIGDIEFIIVRPSDAPSFVACGGADCGICGRDSLIEADLGLLQLLDLRYGSCTFVEACPRTRRAQIKDLLSQRGVLRVATKYPLIAKNWYNSRGINAEIVFLHGNIELAPIVGMTDCIVDITATGATLRDNDLEITHKIMQCSARFFVHPGAAHLDSRVQSLARRLKKAIAQLDFEPVAGAIQ